MTAPRAAFAEVASSSPRRKPHSLDEQRGKVASGMTKTILVVDDEPEVRHLVVKLLEHLGYPSIETGDPEELMAQVLVSKPAAVLLDIRMPDVDARAALRTLKQLKPKMPVIMVTAYPEFGSAQEWVNLGASDYIVKPFTIERLKKSLEKTIHDQQEMVNGIESGKRCNVTTTEEGGETRWPLRKRSQELASRRCLTASWTRGS